MECALLLTLALTLAPIEGGYSHHAHGFQSRLCVPAVQCLGGLVPIRRTNRFVNIEANTAASVSPLGWMIHRVSRFFSLASRARETDALNNPNRLLCSLCDIVRGLNRSWTSNNSFSAFAARSCCAAKSVCSFIVLAFVIASSSACRLRTALSVNIAPSPVKTVPATNTVVNTWNAVFHSSTVQDQILIVCALVLSIIVIFGAGFAVATILWFHLTRTDRDD